MGPDEGQVPAPRRPGLPLRRRRSPEALPTPAPETPRVAEIAALLAEIDALRTTLSTDLSLAAAALESGADDVAAEVVTGDVDALHGFEQRALAHLRALDTAPVTRPADAPDELPVVARRPLTRRMMPAAPVLAAAAALIGFLAGGPSSGGAVPAPAMTSAAEASFELHRLARAGASSEELREVAEELNEQLAALVAAAGADPAAAQQAMLLIDDTTRVLRSAGGDQGELADVLAEARALAARLAAVLPRTPAPVVRPQRPTVVLPDVPQPESRRTSGSDTQRSSSTGRSTAPSPRPTPAGTPSPQAAPSAAPAPTAAPEQSTPPPASSGPVLPQPDDLPGS